MAQILKGAPVAAALNEKTLAEAEKLREKGIIPTLGILRVGERGDDIAYERGAEKRCEQFGIEVKKVVLPRDVDGEDFLTALKDLDSDPSVHGVLVFRPLPPSIDVTAMSRVLSPEKDVDGITAGSIGGMLMHYGVGLPPCTAKACIELLKYYDIPLVGANVTVVGKGAAVGLPVTMLLMDEEATVSVCHILSDPEKTRQLCMRADIIVAAAGCAGLINKDYVSPGQTILDVGINVGKDGKLCGDVEFDHVEPIVARITPVPGGVGSVTTSVLVSHVVEAAKRLSE